MSACFELTAVEKPLFDERAQPAPAPVPTPSGTATRAPKRPIGPPPARPTHPTGNVPVPLPEAGACTAGKGWDFENFLDNLEVPLLPGVTTTLVRGYASFDKWKGDGIPGNSPFLDFDNADQHLKAAPVYGNAIPVQRIRPPGFRPDVQSIIGGDYWRFSQDINQKGDFWIGSLDRRYSWRQQPGEDRDTWREEATGTLTSPPCKLGARYLAFRLGGAAHGSQRVEVHAEGASPRQYFGVRLFGGPGDPSFGGAMGQPTQFNSPNTPQDFPPPTGADGWSVVRSAMPDSGLDSDWMQVFVFDLQPFVGRPIRIRIVDDHRKECVFVSSSVCEPKPEHLQADDFEFLDKPPQGTEWMRYADGHCADVPETGDGCSPVGRVASMPPLWGLTDVHAHPMANLGFGGHVFWGDAADTLDAVYDCSGSLGAIPGPGGRGAISPSNKQTSCYLSGSVVAVATGVLIASCQVLNVVPWVGSVLAAACTAVVTAAAAVALTVPVLEGATMHGASKVSSGAVKFGVLFSGLLDVLPDLELEFTTGLIPQTDSLVKSTGAEAGGWWKKGEEYHGPRGIGRTHNAYQADMIRRAYNGGLRLAVWDVINSRAFSLVVDGSMTSDWKALRDGTDAAKRIVASRLNDIAEIAFSPDDADRIIRRGRMAVILGSEVDELGRMRPDGLPWPRSPHGAGDSMQKQVDDLWALGVRKITPVHSTNNPIGGSALFTTAYDSNNYFVSGTEPEQPPTLLDLPLIDIFLDGTFGALLKGLFLGEFSLIGDPVHPNQPPWNPTDWFDFDVRPSRPDDTFVGEYDRIRYRIGIDRFGDPLRNATGFKPPSEVLGKQILVPQLLKGVAFAFAGASCDLYNTTLPKNETSFGPVVDAHYVQIAGHRNALGLFRAPTGNDGDAFLRAAMKKGMLIDTDHLSQNTRVDAYELAQLYAEEAGWPAGQCRTADGACGPCAAPDAPRCGGYPTVGVHSKVRGLEIDPKGNEELRNAYGYNDEASRSEREVKWVAQNGGTFAVFPTGSAIIPPNNRRCTKDSDCANYNGPGQAACLNNPDGSRSCSPVHPNLAPRDFELPAEVSNDCDESSKTFAVKYLWLMRTTGGRGLTPATDLNGLISTLKPRYGSGQPWNSACGTDERDKTDQAQVLGQNTWRRMMFDAQRFESSGVWYDDYASHGPAPSAVAGLWGDNRYKTVVARAKNDQREDRAPRAHVDDEVFYNDFGPDNKKLQGNLYQEGNRIGAQMYPMKRWRVIPGRAGWDFNLDGLQHIGLYPDLFQDMRNVGVQWEQMGPLFHSARDYIATWQKAVTVGAAHP
jgi:hypothetical protein